MQKSKDKYKTQSPKLWNHNITPLFPLHLRRLSYPSLTHHLSIEIKILILILLHVNSHSPQFFNFANLPQISHPTTILSPSLLIGHSSIFHATEININRGSIFLFSKTRASLHSRTCATTYCWCYFP